MRFLRTTLRSCMRDTCSGRKDEADLLQGEKEKKEKQWAVMEWIS